MIERLGDASASKWLDNCTEAHDHFTPGKLVCPYDACFEREGNIFVVELSGGRGGDHLRKVYGARGHGRAGRAQTGFLVYGFSIY